ncbi:TPA: hypothetical protein VDU83_002681 [Pseudomonas aeruginosa]|nr:hypothetical protein [Pseudomonas aeruginosa]
MPFPFEELASRFDAFLAAITYEVPAIDPAFSTLAIAEWKRAAGGDTEQWQPAQAILTLPWFCRAVSEHLGFQTSESPDSWLTSDSPLACGALHDLLEFFLDALAPAHRPYIRREVQEIQLLSRLMRHVADTGESVPQARARVTRCAVGLRLVA